jgi:hypothetical protein
MNKKRIKPVHAIITSAVGLFAILLKATIAPKPPFIIKLEKVSLNMLKYY